MEAVNAYYDGHAFVPTKPVNARKNQQAIVTVLDEVRSEASKEHARKAIEDMCGIIEGMGLSSEDYMARKEYEKSLEL
jgi:hypothetical protein